LQKRLLILTIIFLANFTFACSHLRQGVDYRKFWDSEHKITVVDTEKVVFVAVQDKRPYVLSGEKNENFIGIANETLFTGLVPVFVDHNTFSMKPLANDFSILLSKYTKEKIPNMNVTDLPISNSVDDSISYIIKNNADVYILFFINDFQTKSHYSNSEFIYDFEFFVFDSTGDLITTIKQNDSVNISGTVPGTGRGKVDLKLIEIYNNFFNDKQLIAVIGNN
jgi:hypothetical protein